MGETWRDIMETVQYYVSQLWAGAGIKSFLAALATIYIDLFHGQVIILNVYLLFSGVDLALGTWRAVKTDRWSPKFVLYWVRKLFTYVCIVSLFGGMSLAFFLWTGMNLQLVNFLLVCCCITELGSIIKNMKKLGMPLPPVVDVLLNLIRRQAAEKMNQAIGGTEEDQKKLEEAIQGTDTLDRRQGSGGRRSTDR